MEVNFNNLKELKQRITPALNTKVKELKQSNISYVTNEDIWEYLKTNIWPNKTDLTLYDIVNDILKLQPDIIEEYITKRRKQNDKN